MRVNPRILFSQRLKAEWKYQYKLWKMAVDWVTWLYILIPIVLILGYHYIQLWEQNYTWVQSIPPLVFSICLYVLGWTSRWRTFLEWADQLFLRQYSLWITSVVRMGSYYSIAFTGLKAILISLIAAPFLLYFEDYSFWQFAFLAVHIFTFYVLILLGKNLAEVYLPGWRYRSAIFTLFILGFFPFNLGFYFVEGKYLLFYFVSTVLYLIFFVYLLRKREAISWSFEGDCYREQEEKYRYVHILLQGSAYIGADITNLSKKKKGARKVPRIFKQSNLIFKKRNDIHGLVELLIKFLLRNKTYLRLYLQFVVVCTYALILLPTGFDLLMWLIIPFILGYCLRNVWLAAMKSPFLLVLQVTEQVKQKAFQRMLLYILLPTYLLISLVFGLTSLFLR